MKIRLDFKDEEVEFLASTLDNLISALEEGANDIRLDLDEEENETDRKALIAIELDIDMAKDLMDRMQNEQIAQKKRAEQRKALRRPLPSRVEDESPSLDEETATRWT